MAFQKTVRFDQAFGVVGEHVLDGPNRAAPGVINSVDETNNIIGRVFTIEPDGGTVSAGAPTDDSVFFGILANPKVYAYRGDFVDNDARRLRVSNGSVGEFVSMATGFIVNSTTAAQIDDEVHYVKATGVIKIVAKGTSPASGDAEVPNARVVRQPQTSTTGGLVVICMNN